MTNALTALGKRYRFNETMLGAATAELPDAAWAHVPEGGGNSAHWILGHIVYARMGVLRLAGEPLPPESWEDGFVRGAIPDSTGDYPPTTELIARFHALGERIESRLASLDDAAAQAPAGRTFPDGSDNVDGAVHFLFMHEAYHIGQLGLIRRMDGLPGFA